MKKFLKPEIIIPIILIILVAAFVIYRLVSKKSLSEPTGLTAQFEYYTAGDTNIIPLNCEFTTPSSYGDGSASFTGVKAYIVDCGTSACTPSVQPVRPTDDDLANQKFIDLTNKETIDIRDGTYQKISSPVKVQIINIKGNYTVGNTYSIGIAMVNDAGITGDFVYTSAFLAPKKGPGDISGLSSTFNH